MYTAKDFEEIANSLRGLLRYMHCVNTQLKANFDPNQPRVPEGYSTGGQWTDDGTNGGVALSADARQQAINDMLNNPDPGVAEPLFDDFIVFVVGAFGFKNPKVRDIWRSWIQLGKPRKVKWVLGKYKSPKRWANQMEKRNWTPKEIDETLLKGEKHPAVNKTRNGAPATRYENKRTGKSLVIDDETKEIIQLGDKHFEWE